MSVKGEILKEATTRAEEAESKHADCVENTNKQTKAAVNEAIDHELLIKHPKSIRKS